MLVGGSEGLTPASRAKFESCSSKLANSPSASLSSRVVSILSAPYQTQCHPPESDRASALRRANIQRDADGFCSLRSFLGMSMQPARHIVFFITSLLNCPCVFNAADEAELCSRPENYGRNPYSSIWSQRVQVEPRLSAASGPTQFEWGPFLSPPSNRKPH